jgi:hypothetical protein
MSGCDPKQANLAKYHLQRLARCGRDVVHTSVGFIGIWVGVEKTLMSELYAATKILLPIFSSRPGLIYYCATT